jgi:protein-S-isoprenylcysteine O-methyltransferase Ste14
MPVIALVLFAVFAILGFGWRSWVQRRRTGSTGFKGISGRPGSVEWWAGVGFVIALVLGAAAPALQWVGLAEPVLSAPEVHVLGIVIAIAGIAATVYAQLDMGDSWRIGVDPGETTTLVRTGVFAHVRNPIFSAMIIFAFGVTLMTPNPFALTGFALLILAIELQVRAVEEPYLHEVHAAVYPGYLASVGRFVPGVGRATR